MTLQCILQKSWAPEELGKPGVASSFSAAVCGIDVLLGGCTNTSLIYKFVDFRGFSTRSSEVSKKLIGN